jgi:hypothetical protein
MISLNGIIPNAPRFTIVNIYVGDLPEFIALGLTHADFLIEEVIDASDAKDSVSAPERIRSERVGG